MLLIAARKNKKHFSLEKLRPGGLDLHGRVPAIKRVWRSLSVMLASDFRSEPIWGARSEAKGVFVGLGLVLVVWSKPEGLAPQGRLDVASGAKRSAALYIVLGGNPLGNKTTQGKEFSP